MICSLHYYMHLFIYLFICLHLTQSFNIVNYFAIQSLQSPRRIWSRYFVIVATHSRQHAIDSNLIGTFTNSRPPQGQLVYMESVPKTTMLDQTWRRRPPKSIESTHSHLSQSNLFLILILLAHISQDNVLASKDSNQQQTSCQSTPPTTQHPRQHQLS